MYILVYYLLIWYKSITATSFEHLVDSAKPKDEQMKDLATNLQKRFAAESHEMKEGKATLVCITFPQSCLYNDNSSNNHTSLLLQFYLGLIRINSENCMAVFSQYSYQHNDLYIFFVSFPNH